MLDRTDTPWKEIRAEEVPYLRECLKWLKTENPHVRQFWTLLERFGINLKQIRNLLPEGDLQTPIQISRRQQTTNTDQDTLESTLNEESCALVVLEPEQFPKAWAEVSLLADKVGSASFRVERQGNVGDGVQINEDLQSEMQDAAEDLRRDAHVKFSDPHLDAKLFPLEYPYGTG